MNPRQINVTALAFVGDAVYELYVRNLVADGFSQGGNAELMHKHAIKFVRAESQAKAVKALMKDFLTEDEIAIVKRARNHKTPNRSRSAGAVEYRLATAFEALVGFLYTQGESLRMNEVMSKAVEIIAAE
ncbi:MAG: ribonuclease III domain-containing protein [Eubacterium sp.]|nr:ribonuclease III domain-containing protein [Eubacterium sp.]